MTWSCEKFSDYILGSRFKIETDHKPLVPILSSKHLNDLPPRVLRFRLRMAKFDYSISHVPGKLLCTADTLSRDPTPEQKPTTLQKEVEVFVNSYQDSPSIRSTTGDIPPSTRARRSVYTGARVLPDGLAEKAAHILLPHSLLESSRQPICNDLLLYNTHIVIPKSLQQETLQKIHSGDLGIEKCKKRIVMSVWWPGVM